MVLEKLTSVRSTTSAPGSYLCKLFEGDDNLQLQPAGQNGEQTKTKDGSRGGAGFSY